MRTLIPSQNHLILTQLFCRWVIDWLTDWFRDWLTDWLIGWLVDWLIDWLIDVFLRSYSLLKSEAQMFIPSGHVGQCWWHARIHRGWREFRSIGKETFGGSSVATRCFLLLFFLPRGWRLILNLDDQGWWGGFITTTVFVSPYSKLRVSWVDLIVVHYDLAEVGYLGSSPNLRFFYGNSVRYP